VGRHDWYRTHEWDSAARTDFYSRLGRAQGASRPQYLRIKVLALEAAGLDEAAEELWLRALDEYPDDTGAVTVREHLGDLAVRRGRLQDAERFYRSISDEAPHGSMTSGMVFVSLAEVLVATDRPREALLLLETADMDELEVLASNLFRGYVVHANAARAAGDPDTATADASYALTLVDQPSQYARHPGVGVVAADETLLHHLRRLAEAAPGG
jgi:tetratricopeptide (TPR) repeat protein